MSQPQQRSSLQSWFSGVPPPHDPHYAEPIHATAQVLALEERERVLSNNGTTEIKAYNVDRFEHKVIPREVHEQLTQYVLVVRGRARVTIGDVAHDVAAGDLIIVPRNTPHTIAQASTEALRVISFYVNELCDPTTTK